MTPGIRPEVAKVVAAAGIPFALGALTPTEVAMALDLGSAVVKIFPARAMGPGYLRDLQGPYPGVKLLPSGGIEAANANDYLAAGAVAVCCGTAVVPPAVVAAGTWADITARASAFTGIFR
ncbi:bifunctional 4-hydroxy-2-oxoglutarate aldolase/2-dehydro-3-deoxy-phosphogluconate aldolase [Arthrobacter sp. TMN-49]